MNFASRLARLERAARPGECPRCHGAGPVFDTLAMNPAGQLLDIFTRVPVSLSCPRCGAPARGEIKALPVELLDDLETAVQQAQARRALSNAAPSSVAEAAP